MLVKYSSNNSGGSFWLSESDWEGLKKAGWKFENTKMWNQPTRAEKEFDCIRDALVEFESVTSQTASDEGCNCCGPPHCFSWEDEEGDQYESGENLLVHMFANVPGSLRAATEALNK